MCFLIFPKLHTCTRVNSKWRLMLSSPDCNRPSLPQQSWSSSVLFNADYPIVISRTHLFFGSPLNGFHASSFNGESFSSFRVDHLHTDPSSRTSFLLIPRTCYPNCSASFKSWKTFFFSSKQIFQEVTNVVTILFPFCPVCWGVWKTSLFNYVS